MTAGVVHPKVVALVPAWKASAFIAATLDALAAQSCPNLEILISDDASPDETAAICERYAARDARFRVIRQPRNLGWTGNVNALLQEARGDYFLFAFHDDLTEPGYVERCVAALEANSRAIIAFSDIAVVNPDGSREEMSYAMLDGMADRLRRAGLVARMQGFWWIPNRGVFRAHAARAIGGLRRHFAGEFSADWPWLLRMSLLGEFVRIPERLVTKIFRQRSLSLGWNYGLGPFSAVTLSAMGAVFRAEMLTREKLVLYGTLAEALAGLARRLLWRAIRRPLGRGLRSLGLRRSTLVPKSPDHGKAGR